MADFQIPDKDLLTSVDRAADSFLVYDNSASALKRTVVNNALDLTSHPVGIDDIQTLTNKTLTAPTVSSPVLSGTVTGTYTLAGTPTFPSTVVTTTGVQTLTNKTLTAPTINTATIANPTLTVDTVLEFTAANGVTVDGLSIKDGKLNTANSVVSTNLTDTIVTNAKLATGTGQPGGAWSSWTPTWTNVSGGALDYAAYTVVGKTVIASIKYTLAGAGVTGAITFSLPVNFSAIYADASSQIAGTVVFGDTGTAAYPGAPRYASSSTCALSAQNASGTYLTRNDTTSTVPFTWGSTDVISATIIYQGV